MAEIDINPAAPPIAGRRSEKGFWRLVLLQFQGAFSDNLYRISLMMIAGKVIKDTNEYGKYSAMLTLLFPVAYLLFSVWAGFLADRFSKRTVTLVTKQVEIALMVLALVSFFSIYARGLTGTAIFFWPTLVLFLMFSQSAFFSPSKYGIIPELVSENRLGWANGIIGLTTNLAIILGAVASALLVEALWPGKLLVIPILLIILAVLGYLAGLGIDKTPSANPGRPVLTNPFPELKRYFTIIFSNRTLALTVAGLAYFWALGSVMLAHVFVWARDSLGLGAGGQGAFFVMLALGIGLGSWLAGVFCRRHIEMGLVPLGAMLMGLFCLPLAFATPENRILMALSLVGVAVGGGLFSVPLNATLQRLAGTADRGGIIAADNYITNAAILIATLSLMGLHHVQVSANSIFLVASIVTLIGTAIVIRFTPEVFLRFLTMLVTILVYRMRPIGAERIPATGGVLLVSNHVSYIDALLIGAVCPRPVRFIAHEDFFNTPIIGSFLKTTRSIPVGSGQRPRDLLASLKVAGEALAAGEVVCLFPEGQLTRIGQLLPFQRGYEIILKHHPAPIMPVYLDGVWGSIFSFEGRKFIWKRPREVPYPVRVAFGEPLPHDAEMFTVRQAVMRLGAEAAQAAKPDRRPLHHDLVRAARRNWRRFAMVDVMTPALSWGRALTGSILFARKLAPLWGNQKNVGVLLPPSVGATLVNYAATLSGRMAVNLNYTIGQETLNVCAEQAGIKSVVTSRKFLEKVNLQAPGEAIYLEDHRGEIPAAKKIAALIVARLFPVRWIERYCKAVTRPTVDSPATIIFSSGSTGIPKGVQLTHFNVVSNIDSFRQAFRFEPDDRLLAALPFFHSFGFTVSLWGSASLPFGQVLHNNPLDAKTIGELSLEHKASLLVTTPTFMQQYSRRIPPEHFGGLNIVVAGAERLPDHVADGFRERFGIEPLQGYGTTECSPVVSCNVPDFRAPGFVQVGHKRGTVGHPLPGIAARTIDPDTHEVLRVGQPGLLEIKGANVMSGYLNMPEKSAEVLRDGWYNTGDMAAIDEDGFITITGRLSRFSKIGGEMVPHGTVEDRMHQLIGAEDPVFAVTAVPDEKKGEQLVVLHTLDEEKLAALMQKLPESGLPNIFIPKKEMFFKIEAIPLLGSGKLDLKQVNAVAREKAAKP